MNSESDLSLHPTLSGTESGPAPNKAHLGTTVPARGEAEWVDEAPRPMIVSKLPKRWPTTLDIKHECAERNPSLARHPAVRRARRGLYNQHTQESHGWLT